MAVGTALRSDLTPEIREQLARRLHEARMAVGMSRTQVAARAKIADNSIYRYEKARNIPRPEILATLARIYGRPVEWFWGDVLSQVEPAWHVPHDMEQGQPRDVELTSVPVVATVAGSGSFTFDETVRYWLPFRQDLLVPNAMRSQDCRMVEVRGDAMAPTITSGDVVMVDTSRYEFWDGRMYLVCVGSEGVVIRRASQDANFWVLTADDSGWRPRVYRDDWQIHGQVRMGIRVWQ